MRRSFYLFLRIVKSKALLLSFLLLLSGGTLAGGVHPVLPQYFGLHIHRAAAPTWPPVPFGSWRLWDAAVSWVNLEPKRGVWDFTKLDRLVDLGEKNRVALLLTLGLTPPWAAARPGDYSAYGPGYSSEPKDLEDWRTYVRTVATRYKGRIRAYEIWNEPNLKAFFSGTPEKMVDLAREAYGVLKEVDPKIVVVSPSSGGGGPKGNGVSWLEMYLKAGGARYADVIGYHFYTPSDPPEQMLPLIAAVRKTLEAYGVGDKPLWNTEAGWSIANQQKAPDGSGPAGGLDEDLAAGYVVRAYLLNRAAGVERFYWYAWDNYLMGLVEPDGKTLKAPARAYGETYRWMTGASLQGCSAEASGNWVCRLTRPEGEARVVWRLQGMEPWMLPATWKGATATDLQNRRWAVKNGSVVVGPEPVMVEPLP